MKRLVFCFDGTWNHLSAPNPTNVVITAQSLTPVAKSSVVQIIHYDPGVGTGPDDHWKGGLFGDGLIDKIIDAYTFLIFNYEPGDELYVFGFSRGAFTARAFVGFVRNLGIIQRKHAARIADAVALYKQHKAGDGHNTPALLDFRWKYSPEICVDVEEDAWRAKNCAGYMTGRALIVRITYLGVWDTVAALGVPTDIFFAKWADKDEQYFDYDLSAMVVSGRHAVSIDEQRTTFAPTLWPNFEALNTSLGFAAVAADAPYQQKWFPGDHGSVGGGGDIRGLSDGALVWILDGAEKMGLEVDRDEQSPLFALLPDARAPLANMRPVPPTAESRAEDLLLQKAPRTGGPTKVEEVSDSALVRWRTSEEQLPERRPYRPTPLNGVAAAIEAGAPPPKPQAEYPNVPLSADSQPVAGALYQIVYGDQLRLLAQQLYGHADREDAIFAANPLITDHNRIFVGQIIYLPVLPPAPQAVPESSSVAGASIATALPRI
jgi:uncharacterized protein (DUF2235 family)/phage tail protein X